MADEEEVTTVPSTPMLPADSKLRMHPHMPIVPFGAWTWNTPVVPQFYYNVYSNEQRIKQICLEIGRIEAYLDRTIPIANHVHAVLDRRIDELKEKLAEEVARLDKLIQDEVNNRTEADNALGERIDKEIEDRTEADEVLQQAIDALKVYFDEKLAEEVQNRTEADNALGIRIDEEISDREEADTALGGRIDTEIADRKAADTALGQRIDQEASAREAADDALGERIDQEASDRNAADTALGQRIDQEISDRTAADRTLEAADKRIQDSVDTEIANRKNGDKALGERIDTEAQTRTSADEALGIRIDTEIQARKDGDAALDDRIDDEATARKTANDTLRADLNIRPRANNIVAGDYITVSPTEDSADPNNTRVVIGSTVAPELDQVKLDLQQEIDAREQGDNTLNQRVDDEITNREQEDDNIWAAMKGKLDKPLAVSGVLAGAGDADNPLKLNYGDSFTEEEGKLGIAMPSKTVRGGIKAYPLAKPVNQLSIDELRDIIGNFSGYVIPMTERVASSLVMYTGGSSGTQDEDIVGTVQRIVNFGEDTYRVLGSTGTAPDPGTASKSTVPVSVVKVRSGYYEGIQFSPAQFRPAYDLRTILGDVENKSAVAKPVYLNSNIFSVNWVKYIELNIANEIEAGETKLFALTPEFPVSGAEGCEQYTGLNVSITPLQIVETDSTTKKTQAGFEVSIAIHEGTNTTFPVIKIKNTNGVAGHPGYVYVLASGRGYTDGDYATETNRTVKFPYVEGSEQDGVTNIPVLITENGIGVPYATYGGKYAPEAGE